MTRFTAAAVISILAALSGSGGGKNGSRGPGPAVLVMAEDGGSGLTFFDLDLARRPGANNVGGGGKGGGGKGKNQKEDVNNTALYSNLGFATTTTLETKPTSSPTLNPTPISLHPLAGTPLPKNCERRIEQERELPKACVEWMEKNPEFVMPSRSPTKAPSGAPSPWFGYSKGVMEEVVFGTLSSVLGGDVEGGDSSTGGNSSAADELIQASFLLDDSNNNISTSTSTQNITIKTTTYKLKPTDDTFLELWRPEIPLGKKDKLKIDAGGDGVPTKVVQLKFGLGGAFDEMVKEEEERSAEDGVVASTLKLTSAKLHLYAITDTSFGGYVTQISANDWNEENAIWDDYINNRGGGKGGGKGGGGGRGDRDLGKNDKDAMKLLPSDKKPELNEFGKIPGNGWYEIDLTSKLEELFDSGEKMVALRISTDSTDGVIYASKEHPSGNGPVLELQFELTSATSSDGTVADTGNQDESGRQDELMEHEVAMNGINDTAPETGDILDTVNTIPTTSPSKTPTLGPLEPTPVLVRPFKPSGSHEGRTPVIVDNGPGEELLGAEDLSGETDESLAATTSSSTSIVSSSFRMTITAIETPQQRNLLLRAAHKNTRRLQGGTSYPAINNKEKPAIIEHLSRVYPEVLSIAPKSVSLVFEDDLDVEDLSNTGRNLNGVIRQSIFRVMAIFDDPNVSAIQSNDAISILDQATIYAFVGAEAGEFINVFKNKGARIVKDPSEYDVTVSKVNYYKDDLQGASANFGDAATGSSNEGGENGSSSSSPPSWMQPTLIAGASIVVFASTAAALLLWRQRRGDNRGANKRPEDSPRSLAETTAPSTPSPAVFMDRFKKSKKKFDYAEFEDDIDVEDPPSPTNSLRDDAAVGPVTTDKEHTIARKAMSRSRVTSHQPTDDIKFAQHQDISFDDSSVSDVSAHLLGAKGSLKKNDPNASHADSLLLDTTMESMRMEVMSALDQVRFDNVLKVDGISSSPTANRQHHAAGGIAKVSNEDAGSDGSLSTGAVPSELYSNPSFDSSLMNYTDATYSHLFNIDLLRNKDSSLLDLPPPPSDAASDTSSRKDVDEVPIDGNIAEPTRSNIGIENAPMRKKKEQDAVSQSITDELTKVMKLLKSPEKSAKSTTIEHEASGHNADESSAYIGTVAANLTSAGEENDEEDGLSGPDPTHNPYDGVNVLVGNDECSTDAETDENDPLKEMNNALNDCMDILEKARMQQQHRTASDTPYSGNEEKDSANNVEDDEQSMVTQKLD